MIRMKIAVLLVLTSLLMINLQACHTVRFELEKVQHDKVVEDTNWFYMFGWFPTRQVDVSQKCPAGAAALKEQTTFADGLIELFTIGIVSPRSAWYYCLPAATQLKPAVVAPLQTPVQAPVQGGVQ